MKLRDFFSELRRRRVFKVTGIYAVVAWIVVQVAATTFPVLMLPDWTVRLVIALFLLGIPVVVVLAWMFDLTPEGVERTERTPAGEGEPPTAAPGAPVRSAGRLPAWAFAALLVAALGLGVYRYAPLEPAPQSGAAALLSPDEELDRSIAVLPFANLSAEAENEYFSDGITEDILTRLSRVTGLRVTSRTSVMGYKSTTKNLRQIGEELGVAHILEGSVRRSGDRVRITAQLINAHTDEHLWSESFDRRLDDIFAIQSEIATAIAGALQLRLTAGERSRLARGSTGSVTAYDLYLRGRQHLHRNVTRPEDARVAANDAIAFFRQALEEDESFALAHAGIARGYLGLTRFLPRPQQRDSVILYARRALAIDPELAQAYVFIGSAYALTGDREAARRELDRALQQGPGDSEVMIVVARQHLDEGRLDEAIRLLVRVVALYPAEPEPYALIASAYTRLGDFDRAEEWWRRRFQRFPHPGRMYSELSRLAFLRGDLESAEEQVRLALSHEPAGYFALANAGQIELARGNYAAAKDYFDRVTTISGDDRFTLASLARIELRIGDRTRAEQLLRRREEVARGEWQECGGTCQNEMLAAVLAMQGRTAEALDFMQRAVDNGWRDINLLSTHMGLRAELEGEPRYQQLIGQVRADLEQQRARLRREGL